MFHRTLQPALFTFCDHLCHRCFLLSDRMRLLSPVSRTQWLLLCTDPLVLCTIDDVTPEWTSRLLTASIRVDWFSLPVQCFLDRMPQLRQGLIRGVFQAKASSPWGGNKSERIEVSMYLPNNRDLDTWYDAVYALPIAWPDVTDIDTHYFKKTSANQLLALRTQLGVSHMWWEISPQWHLLHHHLWNLGPSYLNAERLELLTGLTEDVKDSVLPHSYRQEWWDWECTKNEFQNMGSVAGSKSFVDENEAVNRIRRILQVVCRDEIAMGITYKLVKETDAHKDDRATKRRRKDVPHANTKA